MLAMVRKLKSAWPGAGLALLAACGGEAEVEAPEMTISHESRSTASAEMSVEQWKAFLDEWSREGLALAARGSAEFRSALGNESLERGSLTFPGASDDDIAAAEARIGESLPESYRRFLMASNGFVILALDVEDARLFSAAEIRWLRDGEPQFIEAWTQYDTPVADADYFNYNATQDPVHLRPEYLHDVLQLSEFVESAVVLLNPRIRTSAAEWEGWDFGNEWPGAYRYETFERLMVALRERTLANLESAIEFEQEQ